MAKIAQRRTSDLLQTICAFERNLQKIAGMGGADPEHDTPRYYFDAHCHAGVGYRCLDVPPRALTAHLSRYSDHQFKSTLCSASKVYLQAIKAGDHAGSSACMKAIETMMPEFVKRFPGRKPREVVGRYE